MTNMLVTTESGATYEIVDGLCYKTDHRGYKYSPFKVWSMKAVRADVQTWDDVRNEPDGPIEIGKRMYVDGREEFWLSTVVVSIDEYKQFNTVEELMADLNDDEFIEYTDDELDQLEHDPDCPKSKGLVGYLTDSETGNVYHMTQDSYICNCSARTQEGR